METPIMIYPSAIEKRVWINRFWSVIITAGIVCIGTYILTDAKFMNKPIVEYIRKVTVIEQQLPTNYFAPTGEWLSKGDPVALTPVKEK
jgi:hypothetical protein